MVFDRIRRLFISEHDWAQDNLSAYVDGMLGKKEQARLEAHLGECTECRHDLATLRQTVDLLHLVPEIPLPRSFLVPVSEAPQQAQAQGVPIFGVLQTASAMATLLFVLVLSGNLLLRMGYGAQVAQVLEPMTTEEAVDSTYGLTERALPEREVAVEKVVKETVVVEKEVELQKESERLPDTATPAGLGGGPPLDQTAEVSPLPRAVPEIMAQKVVTGELEVEKGITKKGPGIEAVEAPVIPPTDTPLPTPPASPPVTALVEAAETNAVQTTVAQAQKAAPERPAEPAARAETPSGRGRLQTLLDGLLWALLLATVALWGVTAVVSKRHH